MTSIEKIIVFGASGGTGKQVVEQALHRGHHITAVVRNPKSITLRHERLEIIKGDVFRPDTFEKAINGKDVIISCLGIQKQEPTTLYSEGISNILKAMQTAGAHRIVCLSAAAVIVPPKSSFLMKFVTKNILQRIFRHSYADMLIMEKIVRESNLDWTIIRPPWLRNSRHTRIYRTTINEPLHNPSKLSRADLADYIVNHLNDERTFKALVEISY
jgi:putative NADH-flavin reductase